MTKHNETTIYVLRHGESKSNVYASENPDKPASHYGQYGSSLTEKGKDQAHQLSMHLAYIRFDAIFSSDLNRAIETAEIIAKKQGINVIKDKAIREFYFGAHMSKLQEKEIEKELDILNEKEKFAFKYLPHGESGYEAAKRFKKFLEKIVSNYKNKKILIVCHGHLMRSFLISQRFAKFDELHGGSIKNAGYFIIKTDGKTYRITDKYGIVRNPKYNDEE